MPALACPNCAYKLRHRAQDAGRKAKCPKCDHCFHLPASPEDDDLLKVAVEEINTPPKAPAPRSQQDGGIDPLLNLGFLAHMAAKAEETRRKNRIVEVLILPALSVTFCLSCGQVQ